MSTKEVWSTFRGEIRGLGAEGAQLVFVTRHEEGQPTGAYRIDPVAGTLSHQELPGATCLAAQGDGWLVGGTDGHVYAGAFGALKPVGKAPLDAPATALAAIDAGIAIAVGSSLRVWNAKGKELARFDLSAKATALAADPSGHWLVVGCGDGTVATFTDEEGDGFVASSTGKLHEGAVSALGFEPDELRFRSGGRDGRFLVTHARGALESIDRGGRHRHDDAVAGLLAPEGDLVYTAGADGQLKAWIRGQKRKPSTQRDGVGTPVALVEITVDKQRHLAVATASDLRLFPLDEDGKIGARVRMVHGAQASAARQLQSSDASERAKALATLAGYADRPSIEQLGKAAKSDGHHDNRVKAVELLGSMAHPRAVAPLESLLRADTEGLRAAAFDGLRRHADAADLRPAELALATGHPDTGALAVAMLQGLAGADANAHAALVGALDHRHDKVREAALTALEVVHPDDARASLLGLRSGQASLRWLALLRLFQRDQLALVDRALRAACEDADSDVRQLAYHLRLLAVPDLAGHLRYADKDLHRHLHGIATHGADKETKPKRATKPKGSPSTVRPLLEAVAARNRDICLHGATHLAMLGDPRAFGVLLQLSRESDTTTQVRAAAALQALGDARALGRLQAMLRADDQAVRDAAFSAVERLLAKEPYRAADIGLASPRVDVRKRGLRVLTKALKAKPPKKTTGEGPELLRRALDDADAGLRSSAFKSALTLGIGGEGEGALRFALGSLRDDVRREALTEIMGEVRHPWAWALLLERLDDPAPKLRREALDFARKKGRGRSPDPVAAALTSHYADMRLEAVRALAQKVTATTGPQLVAALEDDDTTVRTEALGALQRAMAVDALVQALDSAHTDVRIHAAATLADLGRAEAAPVLIAQATTDRPEVKDLASIWTARLKVALTGLSHLGAVVGPEAFEAARRWVDGPDATDGKVRVVAARTLAATAPDAAALEPLLPHDDASVRRIVALGLAWRGHRGGQSLLGELSDIDQVSAALCLGDTERLLALLDGGGDTTELALRTLLLTTWCRPGAPEGLLAALTAEAPRVRLAVAAVLDALRNDDGVDGVVVEQLLANDRGGTPWPVSPDTLRQLGIALVAGTGPQRAAVAELVRGMNQAAWNSRAAQEHADQLVHRWSVLDGRSGGTLSALDDPGRPGVFDGTDLVFGTYVGLSGQASGRRSHGVRTTAIRRLGQLGGRDGIDAGDLVATLVPALDDSNYAVRTATFEALLAIGHAPDQVAAEALATGHDNLGQLALAQLAQAGGDDVLRDVLLARTDGLELVALEQLSGSQGALAAGTVGLGATSGRARARSVGMVGGAEEAGAVDVLIEALSSSYPDVRRAAATALASRRHDAALEPLVGWLRTDHQKEAIRALARLGGQAVARALLDRVLDDPGGTADHRALFDALGALRDTSVADELVALVAEPGDRPGADRLAEPALDALLVISGYDQRLPFDASNPDAPEPWVDEQHPRHDDVLAALLILNGNRNRTRGLRSLWNGACWARTEAVGEALAKLFAHPDAGIRQQAVASYGWRVRHRGSDPAPLRTQLTEPDPIGAFLAAEGLALAGHADGVSVLLASVDTLDDVNARKRAVAALGVLADERALDKLLAIVDDAEHALVEAAAEAVGHLASTEHGDRILERLLALSTLETQLGRRALVGLRWFGSPDAWARVRAAAQTESGWLAPEAARLLRFDESSGRDETRDVLAQIVRDGDLWAAAKQAAESLRLQWGPDSLEPDYVFLHAGYGSPEDDTVQRLRDGAEASRLLQALAHPACDEDLVEPLLMALASRDPLPTKEARAFLDDPRPRAVVLAARLLGRSTQLDAKTKKALDAAASAAVADWAERRRRDDLDDDADARVKWSLWAAARHGAGNDALQAAWSTTGLGAERLRAHAVEALVLLPKAGELLEQMVREGEGRSRALAAATLASHDPKRAAALADDVLDDRAAAEPLLASGAAPKGLASAAAKLHHQGIVLPHLVARGDVGALTEALGSEVEGVRLGALEALGAVGAEPAEDALRAFASDASHEEEERKAAWRALRRSRRLRSAREAR